MFPFFFFGSQFGLRRPLRIRSAVLNRSQRVSEESGPVRGQECEADYALIDVGEKRRHQQFPLCLSVILPCEWNF